MDLADIIIEQVNNPECSFLSGYMTGELMSLRFIAMIALAYFIFKAAEKLAFEPLINWIKRNISKWISRKKSQSMLE